MDDCFGVSTAPRTVNDAYTPLDICAIDCLYDSITSTWIAASGVERHDEERVSAIPTP